MFRNGYDSTIIASQRVQPNQACKRKQPTPECDSAIGQHLLENSQCAANYNDDQISTLDTVRSLFHLSLLEASYIKVQRLNPCKLKESLSILLNCSSRIKVRTTCPIRTVRDFPTFNKICQCNYHFACLLPSETAIYELPDPAITFSL